MTIYRGSLVDGEIIVVARRRSGVFELAGEDAPFKRVLTDHLRTHPNDATLITDPSMNRVYGLLGHYTVTRDVPKPKMPLVWTITSREISRWIASTYSPLVAVARKALENQ